MRYCCSTMRQEVWLWRATAAWEHGLKRLTSLSILESGSSWGSSTLRSVYYIPDDNPFRVRLLTSTERTVRTQILMHESNWLATFRPIDEHLAPRARRLMPRSPEMMVLPEARNKNATLDLAR